MILMLRVIHNPTEEEQLRFYPQGDHPLRIMKGKKMVAKLTKPQAEALRKFADRGPAHPKLYRIRDDVFTRLWDKKFVTSFGFLVRGITDEGRAALAEYDRKRERRNVDSD